MSGFKEVDMYEPVKEFFTSMDYKVYGEVKNCDIAMKKEDHILLIELKRHFSVDLLMQGIRWQEIAGQVYIAIPRPKKCKGQRYRSMLELVKRLELGLIFVAMDSPSKWVEIVLYPKEAILDDLKGRQEKKREKILEEMDGRSGDYNRGGSTREPLVTAFRESNIKIACALFLEGPQSPKEIIDRFGCDERAGQALYRNYYGWYTRVKHGVYMLTDKGMDMVENDYEELVSFYIKDMKKIIENEGKA